jgi:hypothetical protein
MPNNGKWQSANGKKAGQRAEGEHKRLLAADQRGSTQIRKKNQHR